MSSFSPGDLVEVVNTPPPGYRVHPPTIVGARGIVMSCEYQPLSNWYGCIPMHDVMVGAARLEIATALLRKISGPPLDAQSIPTLTDIVT